VELQRTVRTSSLPMGQEPESSQDNEGVGFVTRALACFPSGVGCIPRGPQAELHRKARGPHPAYPKRTPVADRAVPWSARTWRYKPNEFVHPAVVANASDVKPGGWADPATVIDRLTIERRGSYELQRLGLEWQYDTTTGRPLNPRGRTGMSNRGLLGKWGPNHAADPIVTRWNQNKPGQPLEVVVIERKDTGEWAIPGGMVDPGETVSATLRREFTEEAGNVPPSKRQRFDALAAKLFAPKNSKVIYRGYVDDPRNTDNAWIETTAMHFHCEQEMGEMLYLEAGDDAARVKWLEVNEKSDEYLKLYASHKQMIDIVARGFRSQPTKSE